MKRGNIRAHPPDASAAERIESLLDLPAAGARFERIFSEGQASPEGFWYDQEWDEWVMLLAGGATVEAADPSENIRLGPGDWLLIPARRRHRVKETQKGTLWLAVHLGGIGPDYFATAPII